MLAPYYCTAVLGTYNISSFHYRTESYGVICLALPGSSGTRRFKEPE